MATLVSEFGLKLSEEPLQTGLSEIDTLQLKRGRVSEPALSQVKMQFV